MQLHTYFHFIQDVQFCFQKLMLFNVAYNVDKVLAFSIFVLEYLKL